MEPQEQKPPGLMASLGRLVETLLNMARNRVELLAVEIEEEKVRLIALLLWVIAAAFLGMLAIGVVTLTIVWLCPENLRPHVLIGFSVLYVGLFLMAVRTVRRQLQERPPPFGETVSELKKDIAWIQSQD